MGFVGDFSFQDIGTPADLLQTSLDLAAAGGRPDRPRWGRNVRVAPSARVSRAVLWDNVTIGDGAIVHECVIADGTQIPPHSHHERCALVATPTGLLSTPL